MIDRQWSPISHWTGGTDPETKLFKTFYLTIKNY